MEIKFRGKSPETGIWVYGAFVGGHQSYILGDIVESNSECIISEYWELVIPETVGQFTNFHDKNGVEIYEGDILRDEYDTVFDVVWYIDDLNCGWSIMPADVWESVVIGNIYDNPELLGKAE